MFEFQGMWLPDGEKHFPEWMAKNGEIVSGRGTYQMKKIRASLETCARRRTAIDVGAHVGFWSIHLAAHFKMLHAFEPMAQFRECFLRNVTSKNVILYPVALGDRRGNVQMAYSPSDSGGTHVANHVLEGGIQLNPLDEYDFADVDFIKIDCEGYEHYVIEGARETIARWKPTVIVEQKIHKLASNYNLKGKPAVDILLSMGGEVVRSLSGDHIVVFK